MSDFPGFGGALYPLFSQPLYVAGDTLTDAMVDYVTNLTFYHDPMKNNGQNTDEQMLIDGCPEMKALIEKHLNFYVYNILKIDRKYRLQHHCSWATKHLTGDKAHKHSHCNSVFSGILYIKTTPACGKIAFHNDGYRPTYITPTLQPDLTEHNIYNSTEWTITPQDGMIVLFPSTLEHSVDVNMDLEDRYSVAFNYWLHGSYGSNTNRLTV